MTVATAFTECATPGASGDREWFATKSALTVGAAAWDVRRAALSLRCGCDGWATEVPGSIRPLRGRGEPVSSCMMSPEASHRLARSGTHRILPRALWLALVCLVVCSGLASASPALSASSAKKRAYAICSWRIRPYTSALLAITPERTAGELVRYYVVASSLVRHRDAALPAVNGPASFDRAIKQYVSANARILKVWNAVLARFKSMPKQRRVTNAEMKRYVLKPSVSAENAAWRVVAELPQQCWPI